MVIHRKHQCMACGTEVAANFDHVGDCEGKCEGTFEHPRGPCKRAGTDIPHRNVYHNNRNRRITATRRSTWPIVKKN